MTQTGLSWLDRIKRGVLTTAAGRVALIPARLAWGLRDSGIAPKLARVLAWSWQSREIVNFTYDTTAEDKLVMCATIAAVTGRSLPDVKAYLDEIEADSELIAYVTEMGRRPELRWQSDGGFRPGRRLAFYLLARCLKPKLIVEAGVDKGLGSILLLRALERNHAEGRAGEYVGIEYNPAKDVPLYVNYPRRAGRIERGDSIAVINALTTPIDLFVHDTMSVDAHMRRQLAALAPRMAAGGVTVSSWTTPACTAHALEHGLSLLTHQEVPVRHWFAGDRIAFLFGYGRRE